MYFFKILKLNVFFKITYIIKVLHILAPKLRIGNTIKKNITQSRYYVVLHNRIGFEDRLETSRGAVDMAGNWTRDAQLLNHCLPLKLPRSEHG